MFATGVMIAPIQHISWRQRGWRLEALGPAAAHAQAWCHPGLGSIWPTYDHLKYFTMEKVFIADDKFADVINALEGRGWVRSRHANSPNFRLKWRNLSNINFGLLRADQFVNHVFNSQQLSNKALLTGHLAFHNHVHHQQSSALGSGSDSGAHSTRSVVTKYVTHGGSDQGKAHCVGVSPGALSTADPETFFPRCWDVSGGGICSILGAFVVSAAVALLRRAVDYEEVKTSDTPHQNGNHAEALAAAVSVTSRYIKCLELPPSPLLRNTDHLQQAAPTEHPDHEFFRRASGQAAADAAAHINDPDCVAVLAAWEAVSLAEEAISVHDRENAALEHENAVYKKEGAARTEKYTTRAEHAFVPEAVAVCKHACARKADSSPDDARGEASDEDGEGSWVTAARCCLRALHAADPQAALLESANAWVVKPAGLSCGRGVSVTSSLRGLISALRELEWKAVVQKYVERPLLVQGYKFDIRQWVLVTSCNPLVLWGFDESYVRFSSKQFTMKASSLAERLVHLCNHSVQKEQKLVDNGSTPRSASTSRSAEEHRLKKEQPSGMQESNRSGASGSAAKVKDKYDALPLGSQGNMWTAHQLRRHLQDRFKGHDVFREVVLPRIRAVVVQTLLSVRESLEMKGKALEWLGFDLMLTEDLRVMLIEVNVSPDVSHSTPVTARLVPAATKESLRLLLDDGVADARAADAIEESRPYDALRRLKLPSMSAVEKSRAQCTTPEEVAVGAAPTGTSGVGEHHDRVGDERGVEPDLDGNLRWRLWHKGEEEPRATLRSLREEKKGWFAARHQQLRQGQQRRPAVDGGSGGSGSNEPEKNRVPHAERTGQKGVDHEKEQQSSCGCDQCEQICNRFLGLCRSL